MLRIGFDLDGVLADFAHAFDAVERRLFGGRSHASAEHAKGDSGGDRDRAGAAAAASDSASAGTSARASEAHSMSVLRKLAAALAARRRRNAIWRAIRATPDFWTTLKPIEEGTVARIQDCAVSCGWEVFFVTTRPATKGDTVERQTERWLSAQGFESPRVLVARGSRGAAAAALALDYILDDSAQNCVDVLADSTATPVLIVTASDETTIGTARALGIETAASVMRWVEQMADGSAGRRRR